MTPLQITILMRIASNRIEETKRPIDVEEGGMLAWLIREQMVKPRQIESVPVTLDNYVLTDRGQCFLDAVLRLPLPGRRSEWVMPA